MVMQKPFKPERDVTFRLYTRENRNWPDFLQINDKIALENSNFNASNPVRILIHGWMSTESQSAIPDIKDAYLQIGEYNCIIVDWKFGAYKTIGKSQKAGVETGKHIAKLYNFLRNQTGTNIKDLVVVGQSLGAHVAGATGRYLNGKVPVVVGLDPCFPAFPEMLAKTDGEYVMVFHTNGEHWGLRKPMGTADFYFNGGLTQPYCLNDNMGMCSHSLCVDYYVEALLNNDGFWGRKCKSVKEAVKSSCMGQLGLVSEDSNARPSPGIYSVITNELPPYAKGVDDLM